MISYADPPVQSVHSAFLESAGIKLLVRREDINHPQVAGNKWWKLKYNLQEALRQGHRQLLTFGGAYSNHIYATAAAAREMGLASIGIIRGEHTIPLNPVLSFAEKAEMKLDYVTREAYRKKTDPEFIEKLKARYGEFYLIPEGGTNGLAVQGCSEWGATLASTPFDYLCLPVGTGGTAAGLIAGLKGKNQVIGFSILKGGDFLRESIQLLMLEFNGSSFSNWRLETNYHFGGYAKSNDELEKYIRSFQHDFGIPLEPVYTAKMMYGIFDLIGQNKIERGSTVLALHTGGIHAGS